MVEANPAEIKSAEDLLRMLQGVLELTGAGQGVPSLAVTPSQNKDPYVYINK